MLRRKPCDRSVVRDENGAALMEFGIVAPVFIMMLMGLFDYGQLTYGQSVLNGAVQEAARASALETGDTAEADAMVREQVQKILPGADVRASRVSSSRPAMLALRCRSPRRPLPRRSRTLDREGPLEVVYVGPT